MVFAVWVDRKTAKVFEVSQDELSRHTVRLRYFDHHTHIHDELDQKQKEHKFYSKVVSEIKLAETLIILGPGVAKHHFQNYLTEHFPHLARKVIACKTVDHPTDSQIVALAKGHRASA